METTQNSIKSIDIKQINNITAETWVRNADTRLYTKNLT